MKKFQELWHRKYLVESASGEAGGGAAGASSNGKSESEALPAGKEEKTEEEKAPVIPEETQKELDRLKKVEQAAASHLEVDPVSGEYKPKKSAEAAVPPPMPTPEQLEQARLSNEITGRTVQLIEQNRKAEEKTIEKYKAKDPLFSVNIIKAREKIEKLDPTMRTAEVWDRAYSMAMGETNASGDYEKHWIKVGREQALKEFVDAGSGSLPQGTGGAQGGKAEGGKPDISKVVLSREQRDAAAKLIQGGFLTSLDEYKENLVLLGEVS